jgi:hypothetical protein
MFETLKYCLKLIHNLVVKLLDILPLLLIILFAPPHLILPLMIVIFYLEFKANITHLEVKGHQGENNGRE